VRRAEGLEAPDRLHELPLRRDGLPATGLVPGDRDVYEALEEIALLGRGSAPHQLQLLVRGEVLAAADQLEALLKL
jgi:hypothetical protein